ncbi:hypothetical protein RJ639_030539 [Escallonia herrerae]|uniref:C3H1-type domain-containing protein n=1 Tax=Escallonia herrerae TaxID=1293975 RepID=A0AA88X717_9ASTE|nr:hypothetical protein RJ639_030539 [Escallonia herrerae]
MSTGHGGLTTNRATSPFPDQPEAYPLTSLYSIFPPLTPPSHQPTTSTTDYHHNTTTNPIDYHHDTTTTPPDYHHQLRTHLFELQQTLIDRRRAWCLSRLRQSAKEAESLRQENINLQIANLELNKQLSLLLQSSLQNNPHEMPFSPTPLSSVIDSFRGMGIGERAAAGGRDAAWDEESPVSEVENDPVEEVDLNRISLPKSISVRSNGFLKAAGQGGETSGDRARGQGKIKTANKAPFACFSLWTNLEIGTMVVQQKVYVGGGKKEPVELQVYDQGMSKTELCNKWQQIGECPYGDNCQFAHGIEQLRPVIRHPRYKTEVCRMVLAGDHCPYGHRCHFRHTLTEQERLFGQVKPTSLKLPR